MPCAKITAELPKIRRSAVILYKEIFFEKKVLTNEKRYGNII
jgi:hypothetical protein